MTQARVEKAYADRLTAGEFLAQADIFLSGADTPAVNPESQVVLLHNASIAACAVRSVERAGEEPESFGARGRM